MGGGPPKIVFADADLDVTAGLASRSGAIWLIQQGYALPTRTYVHKDGFYEVVDRILAVLTPQPVGDPLDPHTVVGPVMTEGQ